ncbi:Cobalamin trafficking protein CblD [Taenia crassiceps]|uniref:Cobalamin trafficking protein CblD n=1 Tax=Taenia crassiceps TaxID=6207 RepID=A0ABR4QTG9_9CEST
MEFDTETQSLVPVIDTSAIECIVCACPQLIKLDLMNLFPSKSFSEAKMTTIIFRHQMEVKEVGSIEHVYEIFIRFAIDICVSLKNSGYWADFIHPTSGIPYLGFHEEPTIARLNRRSTNFHFVVDNKGCCKILRSRQFDKHMFIGMIFTDAPKDHLILTHLPSIWK